MFYIRHKNTKQGKNVFDFVKIVKIVFSLSPLLKIEKIQTITKGGKR